MACTFWCLDSGKTFTTVGEQGGQQPGIAPQAISYVASNIQQQNSQLPGTAHFWKINCFC